MLWDLVLRAGQEHNVNICFHDLLQGNISSHLLPYILKEIERNCLKRSEDLTGGVSEDLEQDTA